MKEQVQPKKTLDRQPRKEADSKPQKEFVEPQVERKGKLYERVGFTF